MNISSQSYKWVIGIICFLMIFIITRLGHLTASLNLVPVTQHYGFTRGSFSIVYTLIMVTSMIVSFFYGMLLERFNVRALVIIGAVLAPLGYLVFSLATSLFAFYLAAVIYGASLSLGTGTSTFILIHNWFDKWHGSLLGLTSAGSGFGGALFSLIIGWQINQNGFQGAYILTAVVLAVNAIPAIVLIRSKPSDLRHSSKNVHIPQI